MTPYEEYVSAFEKGFQGGRRDRYRQYEREVEAARLAEQARCIKICSDFIAATKCYEARRAFQQVIDAMEMMK